MKHRKWMWVGIALVVGVLVMAVMRSAKGKNCNKTSKNKIPLGYTAWNPIWDDVGPPPAPSYDPSL